ncbi:hypothetical protein U8326_10085 [Tsuneonella sp. CC-YZS046]|uniref:hypothetical protein n=1 Tax=Tsuneonella sp. CC-YZS046 TaxID=3042152 RepID=UPI002D7A0FBA|nr:hypothetical protein [Tsuneonella sp. CC-YZS046]WRO65410.1 hypothetical protein U8326_10085 [Tsuneonella sp. CC-YZS046]
MTRPDAEIIDAWYRKVTAMQAHEVLFETQDDDGEYTPEAQALWDTIGAADADILNLDVVSLAGIEVKLWNAMRHMFHYADEMNELMARDPDALLARGESLDFDARQLLSAIKALRALQMREG